jgi:GntR family transcriptional regulator
VPDRGNAPQMTFGVLGPAAEAVRRRILSEIAEGGLRPGQLLGVERDMARQYGVSRTTLRAALDLLESEGDVRRTRGRAGGTFVAERRVERDLTHMAGLPEHIRKQGFTVGARVISTRIIEGDEETARELKLPPHAMVYEIIRTRFADGDPISIEHARLPFDRFTGLLDHPLAGSLYALFLSHYGLKPGRSFERIEIVGASATAARLLGISRSASLVSVQRVSVEADGTPFEFSHDLFRGDRVRIVTSAQFDAARMEAGGGAVELIENGGQPQADR